MAKILFSPSYYACVHSPPSSVCQLSSAPQLPWWPCIHMSARASTFGIALCDGAVLHHPALESLFENLYISPNFTCKSMSEINIGGGIGGYGGSGDGGYGGQGGDGSYGRSKGEGDGDGDHIWIWRLLSSLIHGWKERVRADPQFQFKIVTEEIIGVSASVFGDMACRPNFGLGELDFVFSNLIVCAIVNFALMYILAPTPSGLAMSLPGVFAGCPHGHMFEAGMYSLTQRMGTFVYKGTIFASVGFCAGLIGTAISTMLLSMRQKLDPSFMLQNPPPPTMLNASAWALQLGLSSNGRYQLLNGLEFGLEGAMNPGLFKGLVFAMRSLNNVVGGMSFMMMARLTGAQGISNKRREEGQPLWGQQS